MDTDEVRARRRRALLLDGDRMAAPTSVLSRLCVMQGQEFLPALWALAHRADPVTTYADLVAAFNRGEILRTHVLRQTWHLVAPEALDWALTATAPRVHRQNGSHYRKHGIDDHVMRVVREVIEAELSSGPRTRQELRTALGARGLTGDTLWLAGVVMWAELEGWIVSGPMSGKQHTYRLLEERAHLSRDDAIRMLVSTYLDTRGPATEKDLAWWSSLTLTEIRAALVDLPHEVVESDGLRLILAPDSTSQVETEIPEIQLLQIYDEYGLSFRESRSLIMGAQPWWGGEMEFLHPVLVDGLVDGFWRYERDSSGVPRSLSVSLARPLDDSQSRALDVEVQRFSTFVGQPVDLDVRVG